MIAVFHLLPHPVAGYNRCGLILVALLLAGCGSKAPTPAPTAGGEGKSGTNKTSTATNVAVLDTNVFTGKFTDDPASAGKDPFFPKSTRRGRPQTTNAPGEDAVVAPKAVASTNLVLKGILGSANRRLATINSTIFAVGEEATVKFPGGKAKVKCLEIKDRSVVVLVDGERRELSFREDTQ